MTIDPQTQHQTMGQHATIRYTENAGETSHYVVSSWDACRLLITFVRPGGDALGMGSRPVIVSCDSGDMVGFFAVFRR